jgi:hypothetical protein
MLQKGQIFGDESKKHKVMFIAKCTGNAYCQSVQNQPVILFKHVNKEHHGCRNVHPGFRFT